MSYLPFIEILVFVLYTFIHISIIIRVLLRPHRQPASRIAWIVVIFSIPVLGIIAYIFFGETNIGRRRLIKRNQMLSEMQGMLTSEGDGEERPWPDLPKEYSHLFQVGKTINGFNPAGGNKATLLADSNRAIDSIVADIDAASDHVHLTFYIWLPDNNGCKVVDALIRAVGRGVKCRAIADSLGSRFIIKSKHWRNMQKAGVNLAEALPIGNPLLGPLKGRIDLRNHRKIVVIDNHITYCGSQNCADPEFRIKPKYAPWVDLMIRFEGPVARQNQYLFVSDWMVETGENLSGISTQPTPFNRSGFIAQSIGTGPTVRYSAMPEMFETLMYSARNELFITTPYYVPDEAMHSGLCAAARRGVKTSIIFPEKNDSRIVSAASRSYYADLLSAGVHIYEYVGGLLHAKTLTLDGKITLVGSANMDRRSFELNYENNILLHDEKLTEDVRLRQKQYLESSRPMTLEMVNGWRWHQRLAYNTVAMMGPLL